MHKITFLGHKCTDKGILPDDNNTTLFKITQSLMMRTAEDDSMHF